MRTSGFAGYLLLLFLCPLHLQGSGLGYAGGYNVFVFNNFSETGADTGGRMAVGGTASFSGTYAITQSILDNLTAPNNDSLVVDMGIVVGTANLFHGNAYVGATGAGQVAFPGGGTLTTGGASPIGVAAQAPGLIAYSNQLSLISANGNINNNGFGTITLTGTDPVLDVYDINIGLLGGNNTININNPVGATVLINVIGTSGTTTGAGMFINGSGANGDSTTAAQKVIWNFYQATGLTFGGSVLGTVLAPNANIIGTNGQQLDGGLIGKSFTGSTEFHDLLFTGNLPAQVPEPGSWGMFLIGITLVLIARSRNRAKAPTQPQE
jgi:choice-of-anchor A domain-containing protein